MSDGLDLSALTDDQLVELARACCQEAIQRNPAVGQAMQDMMLSEAEKVRVAKAATDAELAAGRARERERIAREAAARVRAEEDQRLAGVRAKAVAEAAQRASSQAEAAQYRDMALLRQAGELVGDAPHSISILYADTKFGRRVLINPGSYRYATAHLVDFHTGTGQIRTTAALVKSKPALAAFCAGLAAQLPEGTHLAGDEYPWPKEHS